MSLGFLSSGRVRSAKLWAAKFAERNENGSKCRPAGPLVGWEGRPVGRATVTVAGRPVIYMGRPIMGKVGGSRPISRVLSWATIHLERASPRASSDLPGSLCGPQLPAETGCFPIWSCSRRGLPCRRVLPPTRCALTAPFHPCRQRDALLGRSALCCTFRGLAPPRDYLAPRPAEPGLSSANRAAAAWPTPARIIQVPVLRFRKRVRWVLVPGFEVEYAFRNRNTGT